MAMELGPWLASHALAGFGAAMALLWVIPAVQPHEVLPITAAGAACGLGLAGLRATLLGEHPLCRDENTGEV